MIAIGDDPLTDGTTVFDFSLGPEGLLCAAGVSVWKRRRPPHSGHWKGSLRLTVVPVDGIGTEDYVLFQNSTDLHRAPQTWCSGDGTEDREDYVWAVQALKDMPGRRLTPVMYLKGFENNRESADLALESIWDKLKVDSGGSEPSCPSCFTDSIIRGLEDSKDKLEASDDKAAVDAALRAFRRKFSATTFGDQSPTGRRRAAFNRP